MLHRPSTGTLARVAGLAASLVAAPAFAHPGLHAPMELASGFMHPLSGVDHLLAMVAVGLWAAQNERPARWVLPLAFPAAMALGAALGAMGLNLPGMESGIAASLMVLGVLIAFAVRLPAAASAALVSLFALAHGFAHGVEMPSGASPWAYGAGFIGATALLHLSGLALGLAGKSARAARLISVAGGAIAATGVWLLGAAV